ncbi:AIPR family protein [Alteromonas facilis]|uniref:AIPR family protein n=1 Tax=Alteromonas facilis TaxID=2048004 RepID=UPI000C294118|nr:AIPR family protein [Alteromonas facilis]
MANKLLEEEYHQLAQEIKIGSLAEHDFEVTQFFNIYGQIAAENGDTPDLEYSPIRFEGTPKYRIDGYSFDIVEGEDKDSGDLYLVVCDYYQESEMPSINAKHIDQSVDYAERFLKKVHDDNHFNSLEEEDPEFQLSLLIRQHYDRITRIRVVIFTNGYLKTRKNVFETRLVGNKVLHVNVIDLERFHVISSTGSEPIEVDFAGDFGGGVDCLSPEIGENKYSSYLFTIPGSVLAEVFAVYGNRLLEQNVRTYLQARTNVNKGILKTISNEPEMFLAYNNGVTATASEVSIDSQMSGKLVINSIKNFQIVNGGQTTASLLYARDSMNKDLSKVYVQVKLSVIDEGRIETVVPKISEYANTQNKVSLADLASNSPVQIQIQRLSESVTPPQKAGHLHVVKWFYERSRGQYRSMFAYKSASERKKKELEYPKDHLIVKTDLAKYEFSFDGLPHIVSMGAQKCFLKYADELKKMASGNSLALNETWYKRVIAKAILFIELDKSINKSDWYKADRGYKAQIVTYTIAACADGFRKSGHQINLDMIWEEQAVPHELLLWMQCVAIKVAEILKKPPPEVRNIGEFAKKLWCWENSVRDNAGKPSDKIQKDFGVSITQFNYDLKSGRREEKRNKDLDVEVKLAELVPQARAIKASIESKGIASPKNMSALRKLEVGNINLSKAERNALKSALVRLDIKL